MANKRDVEKLVGLGDAAIVRMGEPETPDDILKQSESEAILTHRLRQRAKWEPTRCDACGLSGDQLKAPCSVTDEGQALSRVFLASHTPLTKATCPNRNSPHHQPDDALPNACPVCAYGFGICAVCNAAEVQLGERKCVGPTPPESPAAQQNAP